MSTANLTCYKVSCGGEFTPVLEETTDTLYRCKECGAELTQTATRELAKKDSSIGQIAQSLLEKADATEQ